MTCNSEGLTKIPLAENPEQLGITVARRIYIGTLRGFPCYAGEDCGSKVPAGFSFEELRSLFARIEESFYHAALTAAHLVEWDKNHQFCSKCRGMLNARTDVRAKECSECSRLEFPRISPAIIVLIEKGDALLLARSARFAASFSAFSQIC